MAQLGPGHAWVASNEAVIDIVFVLLLLLLLLLLMPLQVGVAIIVFLLCSVAYRGPGPGTQPKPPTRQRCCWLSYNAVRRVATRGVYRRGFDSSRVSSNLKI